MDTVLFIRTLITDGDLAVITVLAGDPVTAIMVDTAAIGTGIIMDTGMVIMTEDAGIIITATTTTPFIMATEILFQVQEAEDQEVQIKPLAKDTKRA